MRVYRARTAGFCMGVALALQKLEGALAKHPDRRIVTLGPIIHNPQVLEGFARRGVARLNTVADARPGDCVVIRAHGIPRQEEEALRAADCLLIDATCPKVKTAQIAIARATNDPAGARELLLFGEAEHPEVRGLVSYAVAGARVFDSLEALLELHVCAEGRYVLASQTTQDQRLFDAIEAHVRAICADTPVLATICDATRQRQDEVMRLAAHTDAMIIVGGRDSGNTRRLADVAAACGVLTRHVERPEELDALRLPPAAAVGLTAGASTPRALIDAAERRLRLRLRPRPPWGWQGTPRR